MPGGPPSPRRNQSGAAALEFAFLTPLLLLLVFGMVSYGYMLSYRQAMSQGAAEGVRAAAVALPSSPSGDKISTAVDAVNQALSSYGVTCTATPSTRTSKTATGSLVHGTSTLGTCSVSIDTCTHITGASCVTVSLDHHYRSHPLIPSVPGVGAVLPPHLSYSASAEVS